MSEPLTVFLCCLAPGAHVCTGSPIDAAVAAVQSTRVLPDPSNRTLSIHRNLLDHSAVPLSLKLSVGTATMENERARSTDVEVISMGTNVFFP